MCVLQRAMVHREAVAAVERIMERVVQSIRTPPRSPTVRETVLMVHYVRTASGLLK